MSESYFLDPAQQWFLSMSNAKAEQDQRIFEQMAMDPKFRNNLVEYSAAYPTGSAELGLALAQGGIPAGDPMAAMAVNDELSTRSNLGPIEHQGGGWWDDLTGVFDEWVTNPIQGTVRWTFSAWDAAYQMVAGGAPIRARQLAQTTPGMDFSEAWQEQDPFFFEALGGLVQGEKVNIGSGWFPNSDITDEVSMSVNQQMMQLEQDTMDLPTNEKYRQRLEGAPDIWRQATLEGGEAQAELGRPLVQQNYADVESVMFEINPITAGANGGTWATPWSPGRMMAAQVFEPGTEAFSRVSGIGDFTAQIFADPVDYLGMAWLKAGRNSRKIWGEAQGLAKEVVTKVDEAEYASDAERAGRVLGAGQPTPVAGLPAPVMSEETAKLAADSRVTVGLPSETVATMDAPSTPWWLSPQGVVDRVLGAFDPPQWYVDAVNQTRNAAGERWRGGVDTSRKATRVMPGSYKVELPRQANQNRRYAKIQRKGKGRNKYWDITLPDGTRLGKTVDDPRFDQIDTKFRTLGEAEARLESHLVGSDYNDAQKVHGMTVDEFQGSAETFALDNPFSVINATNPAAKQAKNRGVIHRVRHKKTKAAKGKLDNARVTVFGKTIDLTAGVTDDLPVGLVDALRRDGKVRGNRVIGFGNPKTEKFKNTTDWLEANGYGKLKWDEDTTLLVDSYIGGTGASPAPDSRMSFESGSAPMYNFGGDVVSASADEVNEILDFMATGGRVADELPAAGDVAKMTDPESVIAAREAGEGIPMGTGVADEVASVARTDDTVVEYMGHALNKTEYDAQVERLTGMIEHYKANPRPAEPPKGRGYGLPSSEEQAAKLQEELNDLHKTWESGRAISGPGAEGIPVAPRAARTVDEMTEAQWDELADDDWVEVYHVTSTDDAVKFLEEGATGKTKPRQEGTDIRSERGQTGEGLYVGKNEEILEMYRHDPTDAGDWVTVKVRVRKKDVLRPAEGKGTNWTPFRSLGMDRVGAVLFGDIPAENFSFVSRTGGKAAPPFTPKVTGTTEAKIWSPAREIPVGLARTAETPTTYKAEVARKIEASSTPSQPKTYRGVRNDIDPTFQLHGKKSDMFLDKLVAVSKKGGGKTSIALLDELLDFFPKSGVTVPVEVRTALYEAASKDEMRDIFVRWLVTEGGQEVILPGGTKYGRLSRLTGGPRTEEARFPAFKLTDRTGFQRRWAKSLPTHENVNFVDNPTSSYELVVDALPQYNLARGGEVPLYNPNTGKKMKGTVKVEDILERIRTMTPRDKAAAYDIMGDLNQMLFSSLVGSGVAPEMAYGVSRWWKDNLTMSNFSSARFGKVQLQTGATDLIVINNELVPGLGPVLDADLWTGALSMPHPKELKRVANESDILGKIANTIAAKKVKVREGTEDLVAGMKFEDRVGMQVMTFAMNKLWKPFVLLRGAWTLRILMDDQMRMMADGYSTLNHPARIINYALTRPKDWKDAFMKGRVDVNGVSMTTGNINEMAHGRTFREAMMRMYDEQGGVGSYGNRQFIDIQRADPRYAEGLAFELERLRGSPMTVMLASAKGDPVERTVRWLMGKGRKGTPDPARELASLAHLNRVDPAVAERILALDEHTLRNVVSKQWAVLHHRLGGDVVLDTGQGKLINMDTLRLEAEGIEVSGTAQWLVRQDGDSELLRIVSGDKTIVGDIGDARVVVGDVAGEEALKNLEKLLRNKVKNSDRFPITVRGPRDIAESGAPKNLEATLDETVGRFMEIMMTMPSNRLSRSVEFRNAYWERMAGFYPYMDDALRKKIDDIAPTRIKKELKEARKRDAGIQGQVTDLDQVDAQAKAYALTRVEQTLFTLQSKRNISDSLNLVFPFVEAWGEFLSRWGRIMVTGDSNIHVARRFQQTVEGLRGSGFFYENEYGQEVFNYPAFTTKIGVEVHNKLNNLPVLSGLLGGDVSPEVAGNIQATGSVESLNFASGVIPGFGPVFQMASKQLLPDDPKFDWVRDIVTPFGSSGGVAYQFSPAWFKRFLSANGTLDDPALEYTYNSTLMDVIRTKIDNGEFSGITSQQDVNTLITAAEEEAKGVLMVRSAATFFEPASPSYKFQKEDKDGLVWSYTNLGEEFYKLQEEAGGDASAAFDEFYQRFGFLPQAFRGGKTYSVIDRSLTEEGYKFERGNSPLFNAYPATAMYLDPTIAGESDYDHNAMLEQLKRGLREQWTGEQFVLKQQDQLGDLWWDNANKIAASMGSEQGKAYLASTRAMVQENYPAWNQPIPGKVQGVTAEQQMFEVDRMLADNSLAGNGAVEGARAYNAMREKVLADVRKAGASTIDGPKSTTTTAGQIATAGREWLRAQAEELMMQYPMFGPLFDSVYAYEVSASHDAVAPLTLDMFNEGDPFDDLGLTG